MYQIVNNIQIMLRLPTWWFKPTNAYDYYNCLIQKFLIFYKIVLLFGTFMCLLWVIVILVDVSTLLLCCHIAIFYLRFDLEHEYISLVELKYILHHVWIHYVLKILSHTDNW